MKRYLPVFFALVTTAALAQNYDLSWHTINSGGGTSSNGTLTLSGTIGQLDAQTAPTMSGGTYQLAGGFWPAFTSVCSRPGDMNHDGLVDGQDIQLFVNCATGMGGSCGCADFNGNGVDAGDLAAFVTALLS